MDIRWTEILASRGVDTDGILTAVVQAEENAQKYQRELHKERKVAHVDEQHGLSIDQVAAIVKGKLTPAQWDFCGEEYANEVWESM